MSRIEIEFPEQLLRDYVTITETQADMNNVKFLSKKQTELERSILIIVKAVASDSLDDDNDLLTNSCFSDMTKFPSTGGDK